jgi:hypothetical protein
LRFVLRQTLQCARRILSLENVELPGEVLGEPVGPWWHLWKRDGRYGPIGFVVADHVLRIPVRRRRIALSVGRRSRIGCTRDALHGCKSSIRRQGQMRGR